MNIHAGFLPPTAFDIHCSSGSALRRTLRRVLGWMRRLMALQVFGGIGRVEWNWMGWDWMNWRGLTGLEIGGTWKYWRIEEVQ